MLSEVIGAKRCLKCGEIKSLSNFSKNRANKDGLRNWCKTCDCQRVKEWQQNNRERRSQWKKEYYQNNRESISQHNKEYYQSNKDKASQRRKKWYQNNRDKALLCDKEWRQDNPDKARAGYARRRATKRNATPSWANKAAIAQIYAEALWLQDFTGEPYHVDHIVPLKSDFVCGLHVPANLQTLPGVENIAKSNRSWPGQLPCQTRRGIDHQWWKELYARTIALKE
jgi:hypothetical protein